MKTKGKGKPRTTVPRPVALGDPQSIHHVGVPVRFGVETEQYATLGASRPQDVACVSSGLKRRVSDTSFAPDEDRVKRLHSAATGCKWIQIVLFSLS